MIDAAWIAEARKGLEGVTAGPWESNHDTQSNPGTTWIWIAPADWHTRVARVVLYKGDADAEHLANAAHIARMSPENVSDLLRLAEIGLLTASSPAPVSGEWPEHASPLPWTYHRMLSVTTPGHHDWIEDANGNIVVEHVGHIDGPAICAAVNAPAPVQPAEGEVEAVEPLLWEAGAHWLKISFKDSGDMNAAEALFRSALIADARAAEGLTESELDRAAAAYWGPNWTACSEEVKDNARAGVKRALAALRSRPTVSPPPVPGVKLLDDLVAAIGDPSAFAEARNRILSALHSPPQARDLVLEEAAKVAWQTAAFKSTIALAEKSGMPRAGDVGLDHIKGMLSRIAGGSFSSAKLGRWLGWAQAAVVAAKCGPTLDDMKCINRDASAALRTSPPASPTEAGEARHD